MFRLYQIHPYKVPKFGGHHHSSKLQLGVTKPHCNGNKLIKTINKTYVILSISRCKCFFLSISSFAQLLPPLALLFS